MNTGGNRVMALSIDGLCDWPEREQPRPTRFQRRRVYYLIGLKERSQHPDNFKSDGYTLHPFKKVPFYHEKRSTLKIIENKDSTKGF